MTANLHPVNFIILSGILQSMIIAGILLRSKAGNRYANRLMGFFVLSCGLHFSWTLIVDTNWDVIFKPVFWFPYSYLLGAGPLLFFYTQALTVPGFRMGRTALVHFVPVLLEITLQVFFIVESVRSNVLIYQVSGFMFFRIIELASAGISMLMYGQRCLQLIYSHERWLTDNFSNSKDITLSWLQSLVKYLRVLWIGWLAFEVAFLFFWQFQVHVLPVYLLLYVLLGIVTYSNYAIGLQAWMRSQRWMENKAAAPPKPNVYSKLDEAEIKDCTDMLDRLMREEKLYLHETLSLRTLASRLQKDPNLISYILNQRLHRSFYDYVNAYRVEAVKLKMTDPAYGHFKITEIAYECGFNSKTTFNRVFKQMTGKSPSEFKSA